MISDADLEAAPVPGGMRQSLFQRQMWAEVSGKAAGSDMGTAEGGVGIPRVGFWCGQPDLLERSSPRRELGFP